MYGQPMVRLVCVVMRDRAYPDRATRVRSPPQTFQLIHSLDGTRAFWKHRACKTATRNREGKKTTVAGDTPALPLRPDLIAKESPIDSRKRPCATACHRRLKMGPSPTPAGPAHAAPWAKSRFLIRPLNSKPGSDSSQARPIVLPQFALSSSACMRGTRQGAEPSRMEQDGSFVRPYSEV